MIGLIITIIIGFAIAFFSRHVTSGLTMTVGENTYSNIPLFVITVGAYLLGLLLAWIIEVPHSITTAFQIMGLGRKISSGKNTIVQLQNKINKLELENNKLRERNQIIANRPQDGNYRPNIIQKALHRLNLR